MVLKHFSVQRAKGENRSKSNYEFYITNWYYSYKVGTFSLCTREWYWREHLGIDPVYNIEGINNINIDWFYHFHWNSLSDSQRCRHIGVEQRHRFAVLSWLCWSSAKLIFKFAQNQISPASKLRKIITEHSIKELVLNFKPKCDRHTEITMVSSSIHNNHKLNFLPTCWVILIKSPLFFLLWPNHFTDREWAR